MDIEAPAAGSDWTGQEIRLIVADYFEMLWLELRGDPFIKARRNAALRQHIVRSKGSIERKHQNISAVLEQLGLPWIRGYLPMRNFQGALLAGIEARLAHFPMALDTFVPEPKPGLAEVASLFLEEPPPLTDARAELPARMLRLIRKFDPAERDARNRQLGHRGEERIVALERANLTGAGRLDLARKVRWVAQEDGDGAGYDILSFDRTGRERLIEVKTTVGNRTTPFYLSENERSLAEERPDAFRLVRVYDFALRPRAFELVPPLQGHVVLRPINYAASFR